MFAIKRLLVVLSILLAAAFAAPATAGAQEQWTDNEHAKGAQDCLITTGGVTGGVVARATKGWSAAAASTGEMAMFMPGWACGTWLGNLNADGICWWSQQGNWLANAYVFAVTGGKYTKC